MPKALTKTWTCPTCGVKFMARGERGVNGTTGRRCPEGHWHSLYDLQRADKGLPVMRKAARVHPLKFRAAARVPRPHEKAELLALLWLGAVDRLLAQLPARSLARALVEGATAQAYAVSRAVLKETDAVETAERMAA